MSIDTSKIKAGEWVQIAHGDWFEVVERIDGGCHHDTMVLRVRVGNGYVYWRGTASINALYITDHRASEPAPEPSEKAPEVSDTLEWLTASDWLECGNGAVNRGSDAQDYADTINTLLTRKLREGKLPVVAKEDAERQLAAARKDSERLLKAARLGLEFAEDELANLKVACKGYPDRYRYEDELVAAMRQAIDAAIRNSQTEDNS